MTGPTPRLSPDDLADLLGTHRPTPEQAAVIAAPLSPTVVIAGAGSGKTETMASRVIWLVANGLVRPQEVLGLTFTRKAALELSARLADKLGRLRRVGALPGAGEREQSEAFDLPTISTYHAYAGRLVGEQGLRFGIEPDARLLSEAASWQLAHEIVAAHDGDMEHMDRAESTVVRAVVSLAGELGEHLVDPETAHAWLSRVESRLRELPGPEGKRPGAAGRRTADELRMQALVYPLVQRYRAAKADLGVLDFGDQMALAARLARDVPQVAVAERLRYSAVLLDEFQDTSEAQMVLMRSLFGGQDLPITAVGDPHQSIYGWRGASATTLTRFPREFAVGDRPADVLHLSTSWRNDRAILAAANAVAAPLRSSTAIPVQTLRPRDGAGAGSVEVARLTDHVSEAEHVATWIRDRWGPGRGGARSAAVLCRARAQFPAMVEALRRAGLPVEVVGLGGLLDTPEVLDLVALLWVAQEPTRGDQVMRLLSGPVCRLGATDLDVLWDWARVQGRSPATTSSRGGPATDREHAPVLAEAVENPPPNTWVSPAGLRLSEPAADRVAWLAGVLRRVRSLVGLPLPDLVLEAERLLGVDLEVAADPDLHPGTGRAQLDALAEVAAGYAQGLERPRLGGFLAWLDAAREHERGLEGAEEVPELAEVEVDAGSVQVLTVHAAKGLEWDVVAVPGLVEGTFPSGPARAKHDGVQWVRGEPKDRGWLTGIGRLPTPLRGDRHGRPCLGWESVPDTAVLADELERLALDGGRFAVQEERRLAYVAFTRARHHLLLTAPVWSTGKTPRVTSRFLHDALDDAGAGATAQEWVDMPDPDDPEQMRNPRLEEELSAPWPTQPHARREVVRDLASALVAARSAGPRPEQQRDADDTGPWRAWAELLLAERAERSTGTELALPAHLSTSAVVRLASDPVGFRAALRRPVPGPPAPQARLGTSFHAWVEQHYSTPALVDLDVLDLDPDDETAPADDLQLLQQHFLASEWADRSPIDIEVAVETSIGGRAVRGRLDAVFADADGGVTVVDWKTGRPGSPAQQKLRSLQLAVYRLAYARLTRRDPAQVRAAFFFAATGETVRPELPSGEELERLLLALDGRDLSAT